MQEFVLEGLGFLFSSSAETIPRDLYEQPQTNSPTQSEGETHTELMKTSYSIPKTAARPYQYEKTPPFNFGFPVQIPNFAFRYCFYHNGKPFHLFTMLLAKCLHQLFTLIKYILLVKSTLLVQMCLVIYKL